MKQKWFILALMISSLAVVNCGSSNNDELVDEDFSENNDDTGNFNEDTKNSSIDEKYYQMALQAIAPLYTELSIQSSQPKQLSVQNPEDMTEEELQEGLESFEQWMNEIEANNPKFISQQGDTKNYSCRNGGKYSVQKTSSTNGSFKEIVKNQNCEFALPYTDPKKVKCNVEWTLNGETTLEKVKSSSVFTITHKDKTLCTGNSITFEGQKFNYGHEATLTYNYSTDTITAKGTLCFGGVKIDVADILSRLEGDQTEEVETPDYFCPAQ